MRRPVALASLALALHCAGFHFHSVAAEKPLSRTELGARLVSVAPAARVQAAARGEEAGSWRLAVVKALTDEGFTVVPHAPYRGDLEVTVTLDAGATVATLRTDGFFVDQAEVPWPSAEEQAAAAAKLARTLAVSDGMADFFRNSGVPAQTQFTN